MSCVRWSLSWLLGEAGQHQLFERRRNRKLGSPRWRHGHGVQVLRDHLQHRIAREHVLSGEQIVRDTSECVQIGPSIDRFAKRHLRRHIRRRTHDHAFECGQRLRGVSCGRLHETEVEHLDEILAASHSPEVNVGRLDVPMYETSRVRLFE